jgi:CRISPR-associated protein Cas1
MVFDLIEPFRIMAEQTVTYLFTGRKVKDEYFTRQDHGVSLNDQGKPVVVSAMNEQLDESIRYKGRNVKRRYIVQHEAHRIGNILLEYEGYKRKNRLEFKEF